MAENKFPFKVISVYRSSAQEKPEAFSFTVLGYSLIRVLRRGRSNSRVQLFDSQRRLSIVAVVSNDWLDLDTRRSSRPTEVLNLLEGKRYLNSFSDVVQFVEKGPDTLTWEVRHLIALSTVSSWGYSEQVYSSYSQTLQEFQTVVEEKLSA